MATSTKKAGKAAQTDATEQRGASDKPPAVPVGTATVAQAPAITPTPADIRTGEEVQLGGFSLSIVGYDPAYPIRDILANPWNYRIHPPRQQAAARASLTEFGWVAPLIINQRTEHLIDGHLRLDEAMKADAQTAPVVFVDKSEEEERAILAVYDPMTALAVHDAKMHRELLTSSTVRNTDLQAFMLSLVAADEADGGAPGMGLGKALAAAYGTEDDGEVEYEDEDIGRRPDDKLAVYEEGAVRQIMLHLTPDDYEKAMAQLEWLRQHFQVDTNAQAILACMDTYMQQAMARERVAAVSENEGRRRVPKALEEPVVEAEF